MSDVRVTVHSVQGLEGFACTAPLRRAVFIGEQHVPEQVEWDEHDAAACHYLAWRDGDGIVAVARMVRNSDPARATVQRVAVRRDLRGRGIGHALMERIVDDARSDGVRDLELDAQTHAIGFYRRLGFAIRSTPFL